MTSSASFELTGRCMCGAVRVTVTGPLDDLAACHCSQCRRWSGHVWAALPVPNDRMIVAGAQHVRWFRSSAQAERGFCEICGSSLFWRHDGRDETDIALGALDNPTGLRLQAHIFVADKGDYYDIADGLPQLDQQ